MDSDERNLDEELAKTDAADEVERKGKKSKTTKIKRATLTKNFNQHTNASKVALTKRGGMCPSVDVSKRKLTPEYYFLYTRNKLDHPLC